MSNATIDTSQQKSNALFYWIGAISLAIPTWFYTYSQLIPFADFILSLTGYDRSSHTGEAIHFFFYDTPKIMLLLAGVVFFMGIVQTFFSPERTRSLLAGRRLGVGNSLAASLGIVTPFCSCSAVPLFIGFLSAGVPLGVTFSFLIAAPMVNEIALILLFGLFGWQVAVLYLGLGLTIAIVSGMIIGHLKMENDLQDWVHDIHIGKDLPVNNALMSWESRFNAGWNYVKEIIYKIWFYVVIGIAVGAIIHGFVPEDFMTSIMGKDAWWSVPAAVALGMPMYTSAAGVIPIVEVLIGKGAALGTTLAFMMSVIALSLPEILILRKVLKTKLIATFVSIVASGILLVGFIFNSIL
ncbi:permease [Candidatus Thioglobus sp.]|uniref:permease n=1 Tax=Candidatus Thioglobus sp. TaxID=2026721 RepID=UPI001E033F09|nr:permease [Candidatus Thioglobus sp.]MBT3276528.1 permease [Candidatus Thioglobus sp.]MBT3446635.1 permease [Candidatus Thioglobus sp.]MBT3745238.1 permease [Candidatus Thioglobus sp.]MBT4001038.1 permease [Candidatus Thioglobus sp.]MBT4181684.1 permease [Candidatus Thioglobus sp.]